MMCADNNPEKMIVMIEEKESLIVQIFIIQIIKTKLQIKETIYHLEKI